MFIVLLKFASQKARAAEFMQAHNAWIARGFDEGVFAFVGSIQPGLGGAIVARGTSLPDLEARVKDDPFVKEEVVTAEILDLKPSRVDERLNFLVG